MKPLAPSAYFIRTSRSAFKRAILRISIFILLNSLGFAAISDAAGSSQDTTGFYEICVTKAITNNKILPTTYLLPGTLGQEITITACQGEYEPASIVIHALQPITGLQLAPTDLQGGD
jgi:hypothetical protein